MKKHISLALLFLVIPSFVLSGCSTSTERNQDIIIAQKIIDYHQQKYDSLPLSGTVVNGVRVIEIRARQFSFSPDPVVVNKGDKVRLVIYADDIPHGFEIEGLHIDGYDINTVIRKGFPLTLEFEAEEEGVWDIICTISCGFGHSTMKGTFIIRGESNGMAM